MSYCKIIETLHPYDRRLLHKNYHDNYYGFPLTNDNELFGRLIMEINQAGLSWETILKKESSFRKAYDNFNVSKVAKYGDKEKEILLVNSGIIRNKLKISAAIENAKTIVQLQKEYGSFCNWLESNHPKTIDEWVKLFKKTFKFTGGEIVKEFLMSIGYLEGAHTNECEIFAVVLRHKPIWANK